MGKYTFRYSKYGKRELTDFQEQNYLYSYVANDLDESRRSAIEKKIVQEKNLSKKIDQINTSIKYLEDLALFRPSQEQFAKLNQPSSYVNVLLSKINFSEWSQGLRTGFELFILAVGVISISVVIPWHRVLDLKWLPAKSYILAVVDRGPLRNQEIEINGNKSDGFSTFPDEVVDKNKKTEIITAKPSEKKAEKAPETIAQQSVKPLDVAPVKEPASGVVPNLVVNASPAVAAKAGSSAPATATQTAKVAEEKTKEEKRTGYLYRGSISVTNVETITTKFIEKIDELGGRKAGGVVLGWKKGNSSYFHLTMPEAKYQNLLTFAGEYGSLKLQIEKHERIMPDGIIRIIFTIDEKK
jgi:hypothetical protein